MISNNRILVFVVTVCLSILIASVTAFAEGSADWGNEEITAKGFGAAPANARTPGQAKALARRAAIVDAYRNLGEFASGVRVDSETLVKDMVIESDIIKTKMSALIKGAIVVEETANPDGSYEVMLKIAMYGSGNSLASAVLPDNYKLESFPEPIIPTTPTNPTINEPAGRPAPQPSFPVSSGGYTGVVIDCRGLGLNCVMSPVIFDEAERPIYGHKNLDSQKVIQNGMAGYSKDGVSNMARVGGNPLVIKAIRVQGHNANPVVSQQDANRILEENKISGFLNNCAVVFIR